MKILILLPRIPYPLEKGDKLRAFHQIKVMAEYFDIIVVASGNSKEINNEAYNALKPYCHEIHFFSQHKISRVWNTLRHFIAGRPLQSGFFYSSKARRLIREKVDQKAIDHIYCQLFRTAEMVKNIQITKTIDYQDAFSLSMKKRMKATRGIKKMLLAIEYKRVQKYEKTIYSWFDHHTIISESDREHLNMPELHVIRNGVDVDFFQPDPDVRANYDLIFSGNMSYLPNVHTAVYLAKEIMPLIWEQTPTANLVLAGASPDKAVRQLAGKNIIVTGWVNDIREVYNQSKVFIAPMQIGTGLQNKILEAMAMKLPCITSEAAWKPISAEKDKELLIARSSQEYADKAIQLLKDQNKRKRIGDDARNFVSRNFDWNACTHDLVRIIKNATAL
ncbi:MAG: glycosyltransferase [Bacteroidales bacterium]